MKRFSLLILILLTAVLSAVPAYAADEECLFLEPRFLDIEGDLYPVYDTELAEFLRVAAAEAYAVDEGEDGKIDLDVTFSDVQQFSVTDESVSYTKETEEGTEESKLALQVNFYTGAKSFTVNGKERHVVLVSFRGTHSLRDVLTDAKIWDENGFHKGFYGCAKLAYEELARVSYASLGMTFTEVMSAAQDPASGYYLLVTGHSLGGAVANIFTLYYLNEYTGNPLNTLCFTFASPKVCSEETAEQYESRNIINIVNLTDIIPEIGYLLNAGVAPGHRIVAETEVYKDLMDIYLKHSINVVYKNVTQQINLSAHTFYPYAVRSQEYPDELRIIRPSNKETDNFIPEDTSDRFRSHDVVLAGGSLGMYDGTVLSRVIIRGGALSSDSDKGNRITGDLIVEDGAVIANGTLTVDGDLRLQTMTAEGYGAGSGHLVMQNDAGHLLVKGDAVFQGSESNFLYNRDMTAGTLEVRGDFTVLPSTGGQAEMVFAPGGTHRVLLSGTDPQTLYMEPAASETSYLLSYFNILESTNPAPLIGATPLSFEYFTEDLTFANDLVLESCGNMIVEDTVTVTAPSFTLTDAASPDVAGSLTLDGDVTGGRVDIQNGASFTVTGDLVGTHLYYSGTGTVTVGDDYVNNSADLVPCSGELIVEGDFRWQNLLSDGTFGPVVPSIASVYDGAGILIKGDLWLEAAGGSYGFPTEYDITLMGDLMQVCQDTEGFWNDGLRTLTFAGTELQTVDAPSLSFDSITLANPAGVRFLYPLYGISGVFDAAGLPGNVMSPYFFPENALPTMDSDSDGIPDVLDPDPLTDGDHENLPAAISQGVTTENGVSFFYTVPNETAPENIMLLLGLYSGGRLLELRTVTLSAAPREIAVLEIALAAELQVDAVKIFQFAADTAQPLWTVTGWEK